jgi:uncharacterized protein (DUF2236 family)
VATTVSRRRSTTTHVPEEVRRSISGLGLLAAGANVVMQLSHLPVGHGVAKSTVDSGRVDKHPLKRLRTTLSYLAVAVLGDDDDRRAMRLAVDSVHRHVRSAPDDPVAYNAFDPELQLWVAACLYKGLEDIHEILHGPLDPATAEVLYRHGSRLATTLQVTDAQWPADREAFQAYWDDGVARIEMDELTRPYLVGIAGAEFLGAPFAQVLGPINRFFTAGFLPAPFRDELGLPWDDRRQQVFDALMRVAAVGHRFVPQPLREFPFNAYLWDTRQRVRRGRPIV